MGAIIIKSKNEKNLKLISELAERLGDKVGKIKETDMEDFALGLEMKKAKTGKNVSRDVIFKALGK
ncbi:hypothetical protein CAP35_13535 [Chitinophagaceae bacterium IBVUCB1]|nr:hypothetical protein CAP35_13535 [Chitinophagaceae bacterium IBVUCB1]